MLNETATEIYNYIRDALNNGYPPTVREICAALDIRSTSTVHKYINLLTKEGYLEKLDNHNRAIRLTKSSNSVSIPLMGEIAAGQPIFAVENITEYISFTPEKNYTGELFALKIKGESMINIGIMDGDIVVIEQTSYAENGDVTAVLVNDEYATVKTFFKENGKYRLHPENDNMKDIFADNVSILGKVCGLVRYY